MNIIVLVYLVKRRKIAFLRIFTLEKFKFMLRAWSYALLIRAWSYALLIRAKTYALVLRASSKCPSWT
jgi:hypothetical protein